MANELVTLEKFPLDVASNSNGLKLSHILMTHKAMQTLSFMCVINPDIGHFVINDCERTMYYNDIEIIVDYTLPKLPGYEFVYVRNV